MSNDKNELYEIIIMLDRISNKFVNEINNLKIKLKVSELKPEIRTCSKKFYEKILVPLFREKENISLLDIFEKTKIKKCTIQTYLGELYKYRFINRIKNEEGDKRTKLYEKVDL